MSEERVCCMCDKHKKFLGRINAGRKLYCMECEAKINKEHGSDYWKPCSQAEFFESMLSEMRGGSNRKSTNMFSSLKEIIRKFEEQDAKIKVAFLQFDEQEAKNMEQKNE